MIGNSESIFLEESSQEKMNIEHITTVHKETECSTIIIDYTKYIQLFANDVYNIYKWASEEFRGWQIPKSFRTRLGLEPKHGV